jgi:hypothetical protein
VKITTTNIPATDDLPARVRAVGGGGELVVGWDHRLDTRDMHRFAADRLALRQPVEIVGEHDTGYVWETR